MRSAVLVGVFVGLTARVALAADDGADARARASALLREGGERYEQGDYVGALDSFERAYALFRSPKIRYNLGLTYRALGRYVEAYTALRSFRAEAGDASSETLADADGAIAALERMIGFLEFRGGSAGAAVTIDGRVIGVLPLREPVPLAPGAHQIVAEISGAAPFLERVLVAGGQRLTVAVVMPRREDSRPQTETPAARVEDTASARARATMAAPAARSSDDFRYDGWSRIAARLRIDMGIDPSAGTGGGAASPGIGIDLLEGMQAQVGALLAAHDRGAELALRWTFGGRARFGATAAAPWFSGAGVLGARAAATFEWRWSKKMAVLAEAGASYFKLYNDSDAKRVWLIGSLGVEVRP